MVAGPARYIERPHAVGAGRRSFAGASAMLTLSADHAGIGATLCFSSASAAAVPRTCAMSSCKAALSIAVPRTSRPETTPESVAENLLPEAKARSRTYPRCFPE